MENNNDRITALQKKMYESNLHALILLDRDPHQSEYVADHWKMRTYFSGFNGSFGTLIVLRNKAALWTDGRYFLQAEHQLDLHHIQLMRSGEADTPTQIQWLLDHLETDSTVGVDGDLISWKEWEELKTKLSSKNIQLVSDHTVVDSVWVDRPSKPCEPIFMHDLALTGKTAATKIHEIFEAVTNCSANYLLINALDDIAWLLNLRGSDIVFNPVFLAYALLSKTGVDLFVDENKLNDKVKKQLTKEGVSLHPYDSIKQFLTELPQDSKILIDPSQTNVNLAQLLFEKEDIQLLTQKNPCSLHKAIKNEVEINALQDCHLRDGLALVRFLCWLDQNIQTDSLTEYSIGEKLEIFRQMNEDYHGPSFSTIVGYGENGAICHYRADANHCLAIKNKGLLLIDSGGQYPDGTTDVTRTIACGPLTQEEKFDYTMVLKSHIALARCVFKKGTRGIQLDAITRAQLWQCGIDYNHGTGHGVGFFLGVHEGPQSISSRFIDVPLELGMLVTNEPGVYRSGKHGVRIENIMLVEQAMKTEFGVFYGLSYLTLAPIDLRPLIKEMLNRDEITWINKYHQHVKASLLPLLKNEPEVEAWLIQATTPIMLNASEK